MVNPFMSLWLSAFNKAAGTTRGHWMVEMQRQQTALANAMMRQSMQFWIDAWRVPPRRK